MPTTLQPWIQKPLTIAGVTYEANATRHDGGRMSELCLKAITTGKRQMQGYGLCNPHGHLLNNQLSRQMS